MKARLSFLLLAILMACNLSATSVWTGSSSMWTNGSGTEQDPYLIETADHLAYLSEMVSAGISNYSNIYFKQMTDLDLNNLAWTPIGTSAKRSFSGNYDGNGYTIFDLRITNANSIAYCALFGYTIGTTIKNLKINTVSFMSATNAASFVSYLEDGKLLNCINLGNISEASGGLVSYTQGTCFIDSCANIGNLTSTGRLGGIIGTCSGNLTIQHSFNSGQLISSTGTVGGIINGIGYVRDVTFMVKMSQCYNTGSIEMSNYNSDWYGWGCGLVGGDSYNKHTSIQYCYAVCNIHSSGRNNCIGGLVERAYSITDSYFAGSLSGYQNFCGYAIGSAGVGSYAYYESTCGASGNGTSKTTESMKSTSFPTILNRSGETIFYQDNYNVNKGYPIFKWQLPKFTVSTSGENGTIIGSGTYTAGTQVSLSAIPDSGYHFMQWSDGNTDNPRTITLISDTTLTALFGNNRYTITFNSNGGIIPKQGNMGTTPEGHNTFLNADQTAGTVEVLYGISFFSEMVDDCPNRSGFVFEGWFTDKVGGEKVYDSTGRCIDGIYWDENGLWKGLTDLHLFAHWSLKPRVLYNNNYPGSNHTNLFIGSDFSEFGVNLTYHRSNGAITMSGTQTREISSVLVYPLENVPVDSAVSIKVYNILGSKSVSSGCGVVELVNRYKESSSPRQHLDFRLEDTSIKCKTILDGYNYLSLWFYYEGDTITYSNYAFNVCVEMADDLDSISAPSGCFISNGDAYGDLPTTSRLGYSFKGWYTNKDSGELITNSTIANIENAQVLYAHWTANKYTVTFDPNKGSVLTTSKQVAYDSTYGILPIPSRKEYNFKGWYTEADGGIQITENTIVRLLADQTLYAHWEEKTYSVTAIANNDTYGTVSGSGTYAINSLVTLIATANEHYHFVKWSDGNINATRNITVTKDTSFTANFAIDQFTISASGTNGTFTGTGTYDYGTQITLTAVPNTHYHFVQWGDGNTNASRSITVTENQSYTAVFAIDQFEIIVSAVNGTATGGGTYDYGKQVVLTVTPNTNMQFASWQDGNTTNPRIITVTANATYVATCSAIQYTITAKPLNATMGSVSGSGTYDAGSEVYLVATANTGYEFTEWADGDKTNPRLITVTKTTQYVAKFAAKQFTVTVLSGDDTMGSVTGGGTYAYNTSATLTATANKGYSFQSWDDGNSDNPRTLLVTEDVTLIATFAPVTGLDDINAEKVIRKIIKDGQLIILRDGKTYNAQGAEVR